MQGPLYTRERWLWHPLKYFSQRISSFVPTNNLLSYSFLLLLLIADTPLRYLLPAVTVHLLSNFFIPILTLFKYFSHTINLLLDSSGKYQKSRPKSHNLLKQARICGIFPAADPSSAYHGESISMHSFFRTRIKGNINTPYPNIARGQRCVIPSLLWINPFINTYH